MKHDKRAVDHSFGVGSGIPSMRIRPELRPPRPWAAMLDTWNDLLETLVKIVTPKVQIGPLVAVANGKGFGGAEGLQLQVWRWMWTQPPCSAARQAAFTLGHAALLIERWRSVCDVGEALAPLPEDVLVGQAAERELRIAAWHIDDARGEASARLWVGTIPQAIPPHERVYERDRDGYRAKGEWFAREDTARIVLNDYALAPYAPRSAKVGVVLPDVEKAFTELCIASLPDGPWVMTSRDVEAFLRAILELRGESHHAAVTDVQSKASAAVAERLRGKT